MRSALGARRKGAGQNPFFCVRERKFRNERSCKVAVPKRKTSKGRRDKRRANHMKVKGVSLSVCPQCKQPKYPHRVCVNCGFYKGREIIKQEL